MSFLDGMTELKMMFLVFQKNIVLQNLGSTVSRISGKNKKKHEKRALSSVLVLSELSEPEVLIL